MRALRLFVDDREMNSPCVLTLGMFDGMHVAHARLIRRALRTAKDKGLPLTVMTFQRNPLAILAPERAPRSIQSTQARLKSLSSMGVDRVILRPFDRPFASIEATKLIERLVKLCHPTDWFVGYNNTFGKDGAGTPDLLVSAGRRLGFRTHVMPAMSIDGAPVSSSRIRAVLASGDIALAEKLLGYMFRLSGDIDKGGVLSISNRLVVPGHGLYEVWINNVAYTLRLMPMRLGPAVPPSDDIVSVGRIIPSENQRIPTGSLTVLFASKSDRQLVRVY